MVDNPIRIAAAVIVNTAGETLLVRKRGTTAFMQAGGKIEPGEAPNEALKRELWEELGLSIDGLAPVACGQYSAPAAHEENRLVVADLFHLVTDAELAPAAEIEETLWLDPHASPTVALAPLTRDYALPLARGGRPA